MLPIEVQNALPSDPDRLMDVGFDVIRQAFSKKIHALEAEVAKARSELGTRAKDISDLEARIRELEARNKDLTERLGRVTEDNARLVSEKQSLQETVRRLMREALKYENLRRSILSAVSDDHVGAAGASVLNLSGFDAMGVDSPAVTSNGFGAASIAGTPATVKASLGGAVVPLEGRAGHETFGVSDSPHQEDGKAFFREARSSLPQDQFRRFIDAIKALNNNRATKAETLAIASDIFGPQNRALYQRFERLIAAAHQS